MTEYFKPGRAIVLVALLLVVSMGLQICLIPQILQLKVEGEVLEGSTVGVVLIFSYTLTTLSFLFLVTEYFNAKNRVRTYVKLTGLQSIPVEETPQEAVEVMEPMRVKPAKKGLFSWLSKKKAPTEGMDVKKSPPKAGLFGRRGKDAKQRGLRGEKKPLLGFLSRFGGKKKDEAPPVVEPKIESVHAPKTIKVELASLSPLEKPIPPITAQASEVRVPKVTDILAQAALKESGQNQGDQSTPQATDLLKAMNELPKAQVPHATLPTEPAKRDPGLADLKGGAVEQPPTVDSQVLKTEAKTPAITPVVKTEEKASPPDAKAGDDPVKEAALQKYKTVGLKIPAPDSEEKLLAPLPIASSPRRVDAAKFAPEDSEFLKVLGDLRSVVDELKLKRIKQ